MDRLVDEAEGLAVDSSSSVCSGGTGGRIESAEQQLGLLNTITASDLTGECLYQYLRLVFFNLWPVVVLLEKLAVSIFYFTADIILYCRNEAYLFV